jgi:hypothetical protein
LLKNSIETLRLTRGAAMVRDIEERERGHQQKRIGVSCICAFVGLFSTEKFTTKV